MISNFKASQATLVRLKELEVISKILENSSIFYSVMGGFAVDGHMGSLTRDHDDLDMLCYRKEVDSIKGLLGEQGFQFSEQCLPDESVPYKFCNQEKTLTFHIIKKINGNFDIAFWNPRHLQYPCPLLARKKVVIDSVGFYAVNKEFLIDLKHKQRDFEYRHLDNPKHEKKYKDCLHDLEILKKSIFD
ncbi:MAG: hypothetical protein COT24_05595 [Candidatus Kerfeldbacteria bacterium CG08_land_8_20_14_0_20_40_16]|uniref:Uncharacterized protein n=1 Tax=Candidatus Kerfeldbacteria bacterium CG08_land_8_20_14_0_20_40_16 TaxID=2014244 RepID=A0A2H0YU73_9BACT|nr:MAG: hypothetical protein COT24_05595 [Candidatus Kerfeldbacteria bacterium CG08_land_8_20_14_0_20_40_16]